AEEAAAAEAAARAAQVRMASVFCADGGGGVWKISCFRCFFMPSLPRDCLGCCLDVVVVAFRSDDTPCCCKAPSMDFLEMLASNDCIVVHPHQADGVREGLETVPVVRYGLP
ncbi:unnamed protein product, partial [Pylaiella littoralis]